MSFDISFDTDDLVSEIEDDIIRIVQENAPDHSACLTHSDLPDMDDYVTDYNLGDSIVSQVSSLLDSVPVDYNSRCSLGRDFTEAVYKVIADVLMHDAGDCPTTEADALREALVGIIAANSSSRLTVTAGGPVEVVLAEQSGERFCVAVNDAYGRTVSIYGPFASMDAAQDFRVGLTNVYDALVVPMASEAPVVVSERVVS